MRWHNSKEELPQPGKEVVVYYRSWNKYQVAKLLMDSMQGKYLVNEMWVGKVEEFPNSYPYWIELPLPETEENE